MNAIEKLIGQLTEDIDQKYAELANLKARGTANNVAVTAKESYIRGLEAARFRAELLLDHKDQLAHVD